MRRPLHAAALRLFRKPECRRPNRFREAKRTLRSDAESPSLSGLLLRSASRGRRAASRPLDAARFFLPCWRAKRTRPQSRRAGVRRRQSGRPSKSRIVPTSLLMCIAPNSLSSTSLLPAVRTALFRREAGFWPAPKGSAGRRRVFSACHAAAPGDGRAAAGTRAAPSAQRVQRPPLAGPLLPPSRRGEPEYVALCI